VATLSESLHERTTIESDDFPTVIASFNTTAAIIVVT
jgi:hypothetical protein